MWILITKRQKFLKMKELVDVYKIPSESQDVWRESLSFIFDGTLSLLRSLGLSLIWSDYAKKDKSTSSNIIDFITILTMT